MVPSDLAHMPAWLRARLLFVALAVTTIGVGLVVHRTDGLPAAARDVLGDALWAMMLTWWVGVLAPHAATWTRAIAAWAVCVAVELSQLYHAPAIDALRASTLGHLMLGSDFDPRDFAAYALGVVVAALLESVIRRHTTTLSRGAVAPLDT